MKLKNLTTISPEGFIEVKVSDIEHLTDAIDLGRMVMTLVTHLEDQGKPIKILIDSSHEKTWSKNIIPILTIIFRDMKFKKGAIFGSNKELRDLQTTVIKNAKIESDRGQIFDTREEAASWLSKD